MPSYPESVNVLPEGIQTLDRSWRYVYMNDEAIRQSGKRSEELIGRKMTVVFPGIDETPLFKNLLLAMDLRMASRFENLFTYSDGQTAWYDIRVQPSEEGISIYSVDITARKEYEAKLKRANGLYAFLTQISRNISTVADEKELFHDCCHLALRFGNFTMAWIGMYNDGSETLTMVDQSGIPEKDLPLFTEALSHTNPQFSHILHSGEYYISLDIQQEAGLEPWRFYAAKNGVRSCILLPLRKAGVVAGLLNLYSTEIRYTDEDLALLHQLTDQISRALDIFDKVRKQQQMQDELAANESRFRHTLDNMLEGAQIHNFEWRYLYANDALVASSTYTKEKLIGRSLLDVYPGIEQTELFKVLEHCMTHRVSRKYETEFVFPDGSEAYFELSIQPIPEGLFILSFNRTEEMRNREKLIKVNRLYAFNSAINQNIVHVEEEQELLDNTCRIAAEIGKFTLAWVKVVENKHLRRVSLAGTENDPYPEIHELRLPVDHPDLVNTPIGKVMETGRYWAINDITADPMMAAWQDRLLDCGIRSAIFLPIKRFGKVLGIIGLHAPIIDFFDAEEIALLEEAAEDISFAMENFEKARKHREAELLIERNERRFRALIEKSSDIKTLATRSGELLYGSPAFTKVLGYRPDEYLHTSLFDLIHPDDLPAFTEKCNKILEQPGASYLFLQRRRHREGHWLWCEGTVTNLLEEPGVMAMVSNFRNVTPAVEAREKHDFDNSNLDALINNTNDLMWSLDRDYRLITSNAPFDELVKKVRGTAFERGENVLSNAGKGRAERFKGYYDRAFSGEVFSVIEHTLSPNDLWSEISFYPIRAGSDIIGTACHSRNITDRIRTEHLLRRSELFSRGILDSLSAHIAVINSSGDIITVNESWRSFTRQDPDTLLSHTAEGSNYFTACQEAVAAGNADAETVLAHIMDILSGNIRDFYHEYKCTAKPGDRWFSMLVRKFEDDETMIVISHQDITARKLVENQLVMNNESLIKTNNELDRFVYSVSHDLRSPLTSVLGLAGLIEAESNEPDTIVHINMIRNSITRLDNFIRNILNYSRNNRTEVSIAYIPLQQTVDEAIGLLSGAKESEAIRFETDITETVPFYSDRQRFSTIIENLISNAIKYHKTDGTDKFIRVTAGTCANSLVLRVADNGMGIGARHIPKIFDMFYRVANTANGSGIGLYIVRESVGKMQGTVDVSSEEGKGTCFTIILKNLHHEYDTDNSHP
ncbi:hypothetical protein HYN48_07385 [Flavobacterium magnum]|uniref:histidine kinase n=1 Tax=Flavobacterium magnum TaxID=2162713 RepID=A0A2S0RE14_9FLAO|nr:PAS domain S-box protein [Flavobacterium magnum]AWA29916.1 hypothetical protein HYN48_07385 [Flavobacterium magnum]